MTTQQNPVHVETNLDDMTEARVFQSGQWFTVTLVDLDSGNTLPTMRKVGALGIAIAIAKRWAAGQVDTTEVSLW